MSHGRPFGMILVFAALLVGCGTDSKKNKNSTPRWSSFPVAIYTDPTLVPDAQSAQDFRTAIAFWEKKIGKQIFDYRGNRTDPAYNGDSIAYNAVFSQNPWTYASNIAAQTIVMSRSGEIQGAVIMVNPEIPFCGGDCSGQMAATSYRKVLAHELGHFIGLSHSGDRGNIMYPDALPGAEIDQLSVSSAELMPLIN